MDYSSQNGHTGSIGSAGYLGDNSPDGSGIRNLYTDRQLREMAQFAVNVVDAIDPDHVMTKFEYDKNLGNGWGVYTGDLSTSTLLDDNQYTDDFGDGLTPGSYADNTVMPYRLRSDAVGTAKYDPYYPEDSDERGVVYGMEAQEMTFSEVLAFQCPQMRLATVPNDHQGTEHKETVTRYFTYVELRNISPNNIDLSYQNWRVRAICRNTNTQVYGAERYVKLTGGFINSADIFTLGNAGETSALPQSPLHSRFRASNSIFNNPTVDPTDARTWIAPSTNSTLELDLLTDRDQTNAYKFQLVDVQTTQYDVSDDQDITNASVGTDGAGRFFNDDSLNDPTFTSNPAATLNAKNPTIQEPTFILERRQYPDRPAPAFNNQSQNNDNPWVPVDLFTLPQLMRFELQPTETMVSQIDPRLRALLSRERKEPLDRTSAAAFNLTSGTSVVANSVMLENSQSTSNPFNFWQVIYNRPFASPVELFQVPLYAPQNVTRWVNNSSNTPQAQQALFQADYNSMATQLPYGPAQQVSVPTAGTAGGKILMPEDFANLNRPPGVGNPDPPGDKVPANDNRWYRLFEFFEVPTRTHIQLGNPFNVIRTPGKLNLNGIRHADVLAGLLDDANYIVDPNSVMLFDLNRRPSPNPFNVEERPVLYAQDGSDADPNMTSPVYTIQQRRDWWVQFLQARDGRRTYVAGDADANNNPIMRMYPDNVTGLYLPGLADSSPFRSFASVGFTRNAGTLESPANALDQTLFRRLPYDMAQEPSGSSPTDKRHLWEVGNATDHTSNNVDPVMRDRLLSKIYNNTTTRSHVFAVFMSVQYFEADNTTNGPANVLIGGPDTTIPGYRGFFVIDRSKPEEAYDPVAGRFTNYRNLIKYQLQLP